MPLIHKCLSALLVTVAVATLGCRAQVPSTDALTPELARRVEILIRSRTKLPPDDLIAISPRQTSDVPGFDKIEIIINENGSLSKPIPFLLSKDGKTLAQFNKYDHQRRSQIARLRCRTTRTWRTGSRPGRNRGLRRPRMPVLRQDAHPSSSPR